MIRASLTGPLYGDLSLTGPLYGDLSLNYVTWKDRRDVVGNPKPIYKAPTADEAERQLSGFEEKWKKKYPAVSRLWREHWERVVPFFAFPEEVRKIVYTTNAVESLHMSLDH
jgi:putative transposase